MGTILSKLLGTLFFIVVAIWCLVDGMVSCAEGKTRAVEVERIGITSDNNEYICRNTKDKVILTDINTGEDKEIVDLSEETAASVRFCEIHGDYLFYRLCYHVTYEDDDKIEEYRYDLKSGETTKLENTDDLLWISDDFYMNQETIPIETDEGTVYINKEYGEADYKISFDGKNYEIMEGIGGTDSYKESAIYARNFIYKNGKIYAVINHTKMAGGLVFRNPVPHTNYLHDNEIKEQLLVEIDPKTQSYSTIYKVKGGITRIIGYDNDYVYLLKKNTVSRRNISTKKSEKLMEYEADKETDIKLVWAGDTLVVRRYDDGAIIDVMKVE